VDGVVALPVLVLFLWVTTVHVSVMGMLSNSGGDATLRGDAAAGGQSLRVSTPSELMQVDSE